MREKSGINDISGIRFKLVIATLILSLIAAIFMGCHDRAEAVKKDGSLKEVLHKGQLVLGLDANFPPMGFTDKNGKIVGFDIDVASHVCARLGVELVTKPIDWSEKERLLNDGTIDCIWNGMSVTPERSESMCLSEPYMKNEMIFMIPQDSDARGTMDLPGRTIGVQSGSTAQESLEAADFYSEITVVTFGDNLEMLGQLDEGNLDAVLVDSVVAYYYTSISDEHYFVLPDSLSEEKIAIGFRKDDLELRNRVQEIINDMKADGMLGIISTKWFGGDITIVK